MREIKFRAWDGTRMWFDVQNAYDYIGGEGSNGSDAIPATDFEGVLADMTVMQFTGLKDSEGRDIWEGDIIGMSPKWRYEVIWSPEKARWALRSTFAVARAHGKRAAKVFQALTNATKRKVIGNIYENPELLTV